MKFPVTLEHESSSELNLFVWWRLYNILFFFYEITVCFDSIDTTND